MSSTKLNRSIEDFTTAIKEGITSGIKFMGDPIIGWKFVGDRSEFWNALLADTIPGDVHIDYKTLEEHGITPDDYDHAEWNTGIIR